MRIRVSPQAIIKKFF